MSLYNDLSEFYDDVFAVSETELKFVLETLPDNADLLDVGCGTGNKTVHFAKHARRVTGIDPDPGMIAKAIANNSDPHVEYKLGKMEDLGLIFQEKHFSAVICLGNTLVHLTTLAAIQETLVAIHGLLVPGGVFLVQILNYDYILGQQVRALPVLETADVRFERTYDLSGVPIQFITSLYDKKRGHTFHNSTPLYPLTKQEFGDALKRAGFEDIEFFGSYTGDSLDERSLPLIARCYAA